jgi:hypothetical protein
MRCRIDLHGELEIMASCNYEEADPPDRRHPRARQLPATKAAIRRPRNRMSATSFAVR